MTQIEHEPKPEAQVPETSTTGARAFRGGLWQSTAQVAPYGYTLIVSIVAARLLGPDRMGRQSFIAFTVVVAQTLTTGGLGNAIVRYVAELRGQGREQTLPSLAAWGWKATAALGALGALALVAVAAAGASPTLAWIFAAVAAFAGALNRAPGGVLIGTQAWRSHALVVVVIGAGTVVATLLVLLLGAGVSGMLGVTAAAAVAMLVWLAMLARRRLRPLDAARRPLGSLRREVARFSLALSVPVILSLVVVQRSELFFLEHYSSNRQIALYSIAFSATAGLTAISAGIAAVLTPSVATLVGGGEFARIRRGYSRVLRLGLLFSVPLTGAALALGPALLHLMYGPRYKGVGDVLVIILLILPLVPLGAASGALLIGYGRVRAPMIIGLVAAAVDLGLAAALVPRFDALGAAVANTSASVVSGVLAIGIAARQVGGTSLRWNSILRVLAVSVVAAGLARLVLLGGTTWILLVAAAAVEVVALGIGALTFRIVSADDAAFLVRAFKGGARVTRLFQRLAGQPIASG
jgi:O-antigen/teichoic acid export membrane protein